MLRKAAIVLALAVASPAFSDAASVRERVIAELREDGYVEVRISRTLLGRLRFVARRSDAVREIVINPNTGVILRDYIRFLSGAATSTSGSGSFSGGNSQNGSEDGDSDDDDPDDESDDSDDEHDESDDDDDESDDDESDDDESDDPDESEDNSGSGSSNSGSGSSNSGSGSDDDD